MTATPTKYEPWPPLESNPEAFTALARQLGLKRSFAFVDVLGLDPVLTGMVPRPVFAVVVLFPTQSREIEAARRELPPAVESRPFYMHQYVGNACGTFALCHALTNNLPLLEEKGSVLRDFVADCEKKQQKDQGHASGSDAELRADSLADFRGHAFVRSGLIREYHARVACDTSINQTSAQPAQPVEEHFTTFVRGRGGPGEVVELDGRMRKIVVHNVEEGVGGGAPEFDLLTAVVPLIQRNFFQLASADCENNFAILALVQEET